MCVMIVNVLMVPVMIMKKIGYNSPGLSERLDMFNMLVSAVVVLVYHC